jgi:HD-GYP domain-containing protein (c-di-GMP phosphodiesterase class II)
MSETQVLLSRIAALRRQLEQAKGIATPATDDDASRVRRLEAQMAAGRQQMALLDSTLRQLNGEPLTGENALLPKQLTARARRLLEQGQNLLERLRALGDALETLPTWEPDEPPPRMAGNPAMQRYQETVAMAETAVRLVQVFPDAPSAQLRLCDGLEGMLSVVADRLTGLATASEEQRQEMTRANILADLLTTLHAGKAVELKSLTPLAEAILADVQQGAALHFRAASAQQPAQFIACHSLTVAQVIARLTRHDPDYRGRPLEPILAALLHDVGMLSVPAVILSQPGPLDDDQRRTVEAHARLGAEFIGRIGAAGAPLVEAAVGHHERLDGTGYPAGLREARLASLTRLLAVCDVYAALCAPRPYRPALDTRTALTDTLLLAEQGALDRFQAELLLQLSFYPVGSAVELADGAVGVVVAAPSGRRDLTTPARPVVALLIDPEGHPLPAPHHVDLMQCESRSIVRSLPRAERRQLFGRRYPELV